MSSIPTTLGKYQIIREIARSNDIVYEAYDAVMNRRVALKELSVPGGSTSQQREERIKRFHREVKAAGSLAHPNIVTIYEVGEDQGHHFMAMEFLDGHTLRNELDTHGFLPVERAIEIAIEVLEGLQYAHAHGVVHRDIKPENVQLLESGHVKITDFGIARLTFEPNLTMDGQVFGTPSYMSPEQVVGKEIDARSDLFSLGVVLYEMIGGQKPFSGDSVVSITYAIMNSEPPQPSQANYLLWQVLQRSLEKSAGLRFSTAREMIDALKQVQSSLHSPTPVLDPMQTVPPILGATGTYPAMPAQTPYPQAQPPAMQPATYNYNPYGAPYPYQGQGGQTQYPNQPYAVPVYYPPPPRQPLLKPETKRFLSRLLLTTLLMGTFAALVIVGIQSINSALSRIEQQNRDRTARVVSDLKPGATVDDQIDHSKKLVGQLSSDESRQQEQARLAGLYRQKALAFQSSGDLSKADFFLHEATKADPNNPAYYRDLGAMYQSVIGTEPNSSERARLWGESATNWMQAADLEGVAKREECFEKAARAYLSGAYEFESAGERGRARQFLFEAKKIQINDSSLAKEIEDLLVKLGG